HLTEEALADDIAYWADELATAPTVLELPSERPRPPVATLRGGRVRLAIPPRLTGELDELARRAGATFFDGVLAVFEVLLQRYTTEDDFVVGAPCDSRDRPELEGTIGVLLNTVVLRSDVPGAPSFRTLVERVGRRVRTAAEHADVPFELIVRTLRPLRDPSRHPLFQVLLAINPPEPPLQLAGVVAEEVETEVVAAGVDLFLFLQQHAEGFDAIWEYASDLFDRETVERMHRHFVRLLESALANPDAPLDELSVLSEDEQRQALAHGIGAKADYPDASLHELVAARAAQTPLAVAALFEGEELTYAELNERANRLAHHLRAGGVEPDSLVALSLERSLHLIVALLGILKAGGAYVPLDPNLPAERLSFMLVDSGADVLVTEERIRPLLPDFAGRVVSLDGDRREIDAADSGEPDVAVVGDNLAYVIYTSGSTGTPKGVLNTHRGIVNRLYAMQNSYRLDDSDRLLQKTPISFDVSVREIFWPLLFGARIVVARPGEQGNPAYLQDVVEREGITTLHFVPSMLQVFVEQADPERCRSLRSIISGGEVLPSDLARRFFERFDCELHNMYGPTEAAVSVTAWRCSPDQSTAVVPIGTPVANVQIYALDARPRPVPVGVWGEICIGGVQVARGYHRRPELTAERFVNNPFDRGRLYRTGDIGRWRSDGLLEFRGRGDSQVKLRGFRIELGEIESALREHEAIAESAVVVVDSPTGQPELAAYVVPEAGRFAPPASDVQAFARAKLPQYMVPATVTEIRELPLLPSGKLDRNALPSPERAESHDIAEPETDSERAVARLWGELLGVERVGREDNFFSAGGHSLLAARLVGRLSKQLGVDVPLCSFMQEPTVSALAREVDSAERIQEPRLPPLVAKRSVRECSFAQERFWFVDQVMGASAAYNIPAALRLRGDLRAPLLERALSEIVRRHEILRTTFGDQDGKPVQIVLSPKPVALPIVDVSGSAPEEREAHVKRLLDEQTQAPFELTKSPLFHATLVRLDERDHVLHFVFNHLVFDGWSKVVLFRELEALHNAFARGEGSPLPEPALQYGDFAEWQRSWLDGELLERELAHWKETLAGMPEALDLPNDRSRPPVASLAGEWLRATIPSTVAGRLEELARTEGV